MTWRNASTTTVTTGGRLIQAAYTDANGKITSFTAGDNEVQKFWKPSTIEVLYKKIESPLLAIIGVDYSWTWNGSTLTEYNHASLDSQYAGGCIFKGKYYVIKSTGDLMVSSNLTSWTDTTQNAATISTDGTTLVIVTPSSDQIKYSTDGSSWTAFSAWSGTPYSPEYINGVRYLNGKWIAFGCVNAYDYYERRVFSAESTNLTSWTEYITDGGDGEASILDMSFASGTYYFYCYISGNGSKMNVYSSSTPSFNYQFPDWYSTAGGGYSFLRQVGDYVVTPNGKMISPISYSYVASGTEHEGIYGVSKPGQDKNGKAYTILWDGPFSATFTLVDETNTVLATLPRSEGYIVLGVK